MSPGSAKQRFTLHRVRDTRMPPLASPQDPAECPLQFGAAVGGIPASVRENDPLRVPSDHGFDGGLYLRPLFPKAYPHVARRAAIGISDATKPGQESHEWRCDLGAFEI